MNNFSNDSLSKYKRIGIITWAILGIIGLCVCFLFVLYQVRVIFSLLVYTLAIVFILRPIVNFFNKKNVPHLLSVILAYFLVIMLIVLLLLYFVPILTVQVQGFVKAFPEYSGKAVEEFQKYQKDFRKIRISPEAYTLIKNSLLDLKDSLVAIAAKVPGVTVNIVSNILYLFLAPVLAFYILKDLDAIKETLQKFIPDKYKEKTLDIISEIDAVVGGYIRGQLLIALSVGILASIALLILGVDYPILIGFITGVLNIIPYFGPFVGGLLAVIVALFQSPALALLVILVMVGIQLIDGMFLSPNIMSQQVNVHPVIVVFALLIGGSLFGIIGMLLAIPVVASIKALFIYFIEQEAPSEGDTS